MIYTLVEPVGLPNLTKYHILVERGVYHLMTEYLYTRVEPVGLPNDVELLHTGRTLSLPKILIYVGIFVTLMLHG